MKCLSKATSTLPGSSVQDPSTCNWIQVELFFWNLDAYFQNFLGCILKLSSRTYAKQAWEYDGSFDKFMVFWKLTIKTVMFFLLHLLWKQFFLRMWYLKEAENQEWYLVFLIEPQGRDWSIAQCTATLRLLTAAFTDVLLYAWEQS